jgi:hypothetical protein
MTEMLIRLGLAWLAINALVVCVLLMGAKR